MVEELKLAVKVDDDIIEQSLLKQFNNAEKLADKVVFTFKNVNLDNKEIEKQFKDMQKLAGKNPIELPIDTDKSLKMLQALGDEFTRIISIAKGTSVKPSSLFNQLIDTSDIKKGSDELNSALASAMQRMKDLYDSGQKESVEYYATLYKIIEIQKKMWQFNGMGKKSSFDSAPNVKDASERMKIQDSIFDDFKKYSDVASDTVDFVIQEFSRLKSIGEGIFGENGKILSKSMISSLMDLQFDGSVVEHLEIQEKQALATAEAHEKLAKVQKDVSSTPIKDTFQGQTPEIDKTTNSVNELVEAEKELVEVSKQAQKIDLSNLGHTDNSQPANVEKYQQSTTRAPRNSKLLSADNKLELGTELKRLQTEIIASLDETTTFIKEVTDFYDSQNNLVKTQMKVLDKNNSMRTYTTSYSVDKEGNANTWTSHITTEKIAEAKKAEEKAIKEVQSQKDAFHKKNLNAIDMEIKKREEESSAYAKTLKSQMEERYSAISSMEKSLDNYNSKLEKFSVKPANGHRYPVYQQQIDNLTKKINELDTLKNNLSKKDIIDESDMKSVNALQQEIDELILKMNNMSAGERGFDPLGADKALEKINSELKKNSAMSKEAKRQIQGFYDEIRSGNPSKPIKDLLDDMYKLIQAERLAGREGKSFMDIFKEKVVYGAAANMAGMIGIYDIINAGREGITVIRELDTALTEMRKVSDESISTLKEFQGISFDLADGVGTTAKQIQNSTADYMRLGESLDEATESARVANILLNVSEFDNIDDATSSLVSMGQAYKDLDKIEIVDKLNEVGNNYAISTDELAVAMQKSAATLSLMGNSIDETASMITTANSVLQDADTVSAGLRTISLRIVGTEQAEEQLEAMNEEIDAFVTQTNAKKQQIIKDYTAVASNNYKGFDILDENGNYKSTYDILLGISKIYKEIQEEDKKLGTNRAVALVEELAGKNRSNVASAILSDPTQLEEVKKSSEEALGSAQEELDKFLESIDGKHLPYYIEIYN